MVTPPLVNEAKEDGRRLLEKLDAENVPVTAAFWMYSPEAEQWRLYIATPERPKEGKAKVIATIREMLARMNPPARITLNDVWTVYPKETAVLIVTGCHRTGPGIHGIDIPAGSRFSTTVAAAYIYRTT